MKEVDTVDEADEREHARARQRGHDRNSADPVRHFDTSSNKNASSSCTGLC